MKTTRKLGKSSRGFTIVELLIVVVVIAILAAITLVSYNGIQNRAKVSAVTTAVNQAAKKVQLFAVDNSDTYPADQSAFNALGVSSGGASYQYSANNTSSPKTYCITSTIGALSYFQNNTTNTTPSAGACPGHGAGGVVPITNLAKNPTGAGGTSGWEIVSTGMSGPTVLPSGGPEGQAAVTGARTSGGSLYLGYGLTGSQVYIPVTGGETYNSSLYAKVTQAGTTTIGILVRFYDASGTQLDTNANNGYATIANGVWTRFSRTDTAPIGSVKARVLAIGSSSSFSTGDSMTVSKVMVVKGSTVYTYGDGASAGWAWGPGGAYNDVSNGPPL